MLALGRGFYYISSVAESNNRLLVKVASPEGLAYSAAAISLTLQTADGVIQVLPGHTDLITALEAGEMIVIDEHGKENVFALGDGFALIDSNVITLLANFAEDDAFTVEEKVEMALRSAEDALRDADKLSPQDRDAQELLLRKSNVQLQVFRSRQKHRSAR